MRQRKAEGVPLDQKDYPIWVISKFYLQAFGKDRNKLWTANSLFYGKDFKGKIYEYLVELKEDAKEVDITVGRINIYRRPRTESLRPCKICGAIDGHLSQCPNDPLSRQRFGG